MQRRVAALTMTSEQIEAGEDDENERNKLLPSCRCVLACSIRYPYRRGGFRTTAAGSMVAEPS